MTWYTFGSRSAISTDGDLLTEGSGQFYQLGDTSFGTPLAIRDPQSESAMSEVLVSSQGATQTYQAEVAIGLWKSNDGPAILMVSEDGLLEQVRIASQAALDSATASQSSAASASDAAALAASIGATTVIPTGGNVGDVLTKTNVNTTAWAAPTGGGSGISGAPATWPSTFPSAPHTHPASQISDMTSIGRQVATATDQSTARSAIGAGVGNGNSNLALGTTATTAAPGNHAHKASDVTFTPTGSVTATNVQDAIVQAAALGGGGSTGTSALPWTVVVIDYDFTSGTWPIRADRIPAGTNAVGVWRGPTVPVVGGVYAVSGVDEYRRRDA